MIKILFVCLGNICRSPTAHGVLQQRIKAQNQEAETIRTGGEAAVAGGFTAVAAMPNTRPPIDTASLAQFVVSEAHRHSPARVFPIGLPHAPRPANGRRSINSETVL